MKIARIPTSLFLVSAESDLVLALGACPNGAGSSSPWFAGSLMRNISKASCLLAGALVDIFDAKYFLGLAARDAGQFDEAERLLSESLAGRLSNSGEFHEATVDAKRALEALREERFETPKAMKLVAQSGE